MEQFKDFISKYWQFIFYMAGAFITLGGFIQVIHNQQLRTEKAEQRIEKLEKQVNEEDEERIDELEEWKRYEEGREAGRKEAYLEIKK